MTICDGKHSENVKATGRMGIKGDVQIDGEWAHVKLQFSIHGKHYCNQCFADRFEKLDFKKVTEGAARAARNAARDAERAEKEGRKE